MLGSFAQVVEVASALLEQALALSADERTELAARILDSLHGADSEIALDVLASEWADEVERRAQQVTSGAVQTEDWATVLERVASDRRTRWDAPQTQV